MARSDAQIQQDVYRELHWDDRVTETDVGVEVDHGIVTLTGTVESYAARLAAQRAAHQVYGVHDVANDLVVRLPGSPGHTDTDLADAVRRTLQWHVLVPHQRIHSTVAKGWVTLEGEVDSWRQRTDAERAVSHLSGVAGVTNKLSVSGRRVAAATIQSTIEEALERQAEREAKRVQVIVAGGEVTLRGTVRNWREKRAVLGAAGHAPGVLRVHDEIRVDAFA
jgi:osmotically-inducible protein OsmY